MQVQHSITQKLEEALRPLHLEVLNESHQHSVPRGAETHFKVVLVSAAFDGKRSVARHRQVYAALAAELAGGVHALALHTYTADEWIARSGASPASPACLGGSKAD